MCGLCKTTVADVFGYHFMSGCCKGNRRFKTHDTVRDTWCAMGTAAGHRSHTESSTLIKSVNARNPKKRMDVVMDLYEGALPLLGDIAVVDPRAMDMNQLATGESREYEVGKAASDKEESKYKHYKELCPNDVQSNKLCVFKPLIFESFGRWGSDARIVFKHLVDRIVSRDGKPKSTVASYWRSRLCFAMHKMSAHGMRQMAYGHDSRDFERYTSDMKEVDMDWYHNCKC